MLRRADQEYTDQEYADQASRAPSEIEVDACWIAAAGVVIAEAAAALTAAILMYSWMYSAKADTWLAACSGAGSRWLRVPPPRRRQRAAAAELPCVRRGKTTRACAHGQQRDARPRFTALLKVTKSTFWGA